MKQPKYFKHIKKQSRIYQFQEIRDLLQEIVEKHLDIGVLLLRKRIIKSIKGNGQKINLEWF